MKATVVCICNWWAKIAQTYHLTNFLSKTFKLTLQSVGISHFISSAYHPESQGALERWYQALKSMLSKYSHDTGNKVVPFGFFLPSIMQSKSLWGSAQLNLCSATSPLKVLKEQFLCISSSKTNNGFCFPPLHSSTFKMNQSLTYSLWNSLWGRGRKNVFVAIHKTFM